MSQLALAADFTLSGLKRDLTSDEVSALLHVPIRCFDAGAFPFPWQPDSLPTPEAARSNRDWMHQSLQHDMEEGRISSVFRNFDQTMLMRLTGQTSTSAVSCAAARRDHLVQEMPQLSGPATLLDENRSGAQLRLAGTHNPFAGVIVMPPHDWPPQLAFSLLTQCPVHLLERTPESWAITARQFLQLHESAHILQGVSVSCALPPDRKDWLTSGDAPQDREHDVFLRELDADLLATHLARHYGMSDAQLGLSRSIRLLHAFTSGEKRYWFGPHLLGHHADRAACMDAQREINITSLYEAMGQPPPSAQTILRWTRSFHTGDVPADVQSFKNQSNELDAGLAQQPNELALLFSALSKLARQHSFSTPAAQALAKATADSAALFMPKLMGYDPLKIKP